VWVSGHILTKQISGKKMNNYFSQYPTIAMSDYFYGFIALFHSEMELSEITERLDQLKLEYTTFRQKYPHLDRYCCYGKFGLTEFVYLIRQTKGDIHELDRDFSEASMMDADFMAPIIEHIRSCQTSDLANAFLCKTNPLENLFYKNSEDLLSTFEVETESTTRQVVAKLDFNRYDINDRELYHLIPVTDEFSKEELVKRYNKYRAIKKHFTNQSNI
jgi:hypothetical protein